MEALVILALLMALGYVGLSVYILVLSMSVMRTHRSAMHALHQRLERDRLADLEQRKAARP